MCKYCKMNDSGLAEDIVKDREINLGILNKVTINACIQDKNVLSIYLMNDYNDVLAEYNTKIRYCPICGRKLGEAENDME